jgi:hypothetical protein
MAGLRNSDLRALEGVCRMGGAMVAPGRPSEAILGLASGLLGPSAHRLWSISTASKALNRANAHRLAERHDCHKSFKGD